MKLVLIRHGKTEANEKHAYLGSTDQPVTAASFEEISEKRKQGIYPDPEGYHVYTSGMRRTEDTLTAVYGNLAHDVLTEFREIDFGEFECRTYEELKDLPSYQAWLSDFENMPCTGGESYAAMKERVFAGLKKLLSRNEDAILFTHGGPCAAIMAELFPEEGKNFYEWNPRHGEGYFITFSEGKSCGYTALS